MEIRKMLLTGDVTSEYSESGLSNAADDIGAKADLLDEKVEAMFSIIKAMGDCWKGKGYEAFRTYCDTYKEQKIVPMIDELRDKGAKFEEVAGLAETNTSSVEGLFE